MAESKGSAQAEERPAASRDGAGVSKASGRSATRRGNPVSRLIRFVREVVAELRKVIWPSRKDLITYTTVVVVFVTIMVAIVWALDRAFAWTVLRVFGGE